MAQFSLYVHEGGSKPYLFHSFHRDKISVISFISPSSGDSPGPVY